jgi:hypothetical protein
MLWNDNKYLLSRTTAACPDEYTDYEVKKAIIETRASSTGPRAAMRRLMQAASQKQCEVMASWTPGL